MCNNWTSCQGDIKKNLFNLIILDLKLGKERGSVLCRKFKAIQPTPILILSGVDHDDSKLLCHEYGMDGYITKPCNNQLLLAQIKVILRRYQTDENQGYVYEFANWKLNTESTLLTDPAGNNIQLTSSAYDLLLAFLKNPKKVLNRDHLINVIRNRSGLPFERTLDVQVCRLRKNLNDNGTKPKFIKTIHGKGYQFLSQINYHKLISNSFTRAYGSTIPV